jgi:hypothetical protein
VGFPFPFGFGFEFESEIEFGLLMRGGEEEEGKGLE